MCLFWRQILFWRSQQREKKKNNDSLTHPSLDRLLLLRMNNKHLSWHCTTFSFSIYKSLMSKWVYKACCWLCNVHILHCFKFSIKLNFATFVCRAPTALWHEIVDGSGVNNNHLDHRVGAHSISIHTISQWELKWPFNSLWQGANFSKCEICSVEKKERVEEGLSYFYRNKVCPGIDMTIYWSFSPLLTRLLF